jgi:spermidine synthase
MTRPWRTVDRAETDDGPLELRTRGSGEFLITLSGRVLMNSSARRSEEALAEVACAAIEASAAPRVLIGGLGMGCTLRAALDGLPPDATLVVAELHDAVLNWCRGPLAELTDASVEDPRVEVRLDDVARVIEAATRPGAERFDAIVLDLYEGPHPATQPAEHPHYGPAALARSRRALSDRGLLAIWSEDPDAAFERRLRGAGFAVERQRPGRGGRRHAVYLARSRSG